MRWLAESEISFSCAGCVSLVCFYEVAPIVTDFFSRALPELIATSFAALLYFNVYFFS